MTARRAKMRIVGAVLLGMATVLQPKADPAEHWATPPRPPAVALDEDPAGNDEPRDAIARALLRTDGWWR